jgi:hypothetical protein
MRMYLKFGRGRLNSKHKHILAKTYYLTTRMPIFLVMGCLVVVTSPFWGLIVGIEKLEDWVSSELGL